MRLAAPLSVCLGLALAAQAAAQQHRFNSNLSAPPQAETVRLPAGPLCDKCLAKMPKRVTADPRDVAMAGSPAMVASAHSDCAACDASSNGFAYVGPNVDAPGYASVGGGMNGVTAEPMPIGVMHASAGVAPVPHNAAHAATAHSGTASAPMASAPMGHSMSYPGYHRQSVVAHVLGLPRLGVMAEQRAAKRRQQHAAIRYDEGVSRVSTLPASAVYSR